jgi:hypothetical protein
MAQVRDAVPPRYFISAVRRDIAIEDKPVVGALMKLPSVNCLVPASSSFDAACPGLQAPQHTAEYRAFLRFAKIPFRSSESDRLNRGRKSRPCRVA